MRISSAAVLALTGVLAGAAPAIALDSPVRQARPAGSAYASASDAMRAAARDLSAGDMVGALAPLEYAAKQGNPLALWKLGRIYATGDGVPADELKAFEYFSRIVDGHSYEGPGSVNATVVGNAFVALGSYFLDGIKGTYVTPDTGRAREMFHNAGAYFGNPNGQYNLARLYLEGIGVKQDARQAARWLNLAAEKGHAPAQALLGTLLVNGQGGIPRQRALGLMWLTLARQAAASPKDAWISELYDRGAEVASESDRQRALSYVEQFEKRKR